MYYIIREEKGIDLKIEEVYNAKYKQGFWFTGIMEEFDMETPDLFQKFGIKVPDRITVTIKYTDVAKKLDEMGLYNSAGGIEYNGFPQEGDLIIVPFQNKSLKYINYNSLDDLLNSGEFSIKYLYQVTHVDNKHVVFNGKMYYYRLMCKVYEKASSDAFTSDLSIINNKINNSPETLPQNQDIYNKFKDSFNTMIETTDGGITDTSKYD
jgi:hypothetical protein